MTSDSTADRDIWVRRRTADAWNVYRHPDAPGLTVRLPPHRSFLSIIAAGEALVGRRYSWSWEWDMDHPNPAAIMSTKTPPR